MSNVKNQRSIRLNLCRSVPPEFLRSFLSLLRSCMYIKLKKKCRIIKSRRGPEPAARITQMKQVISRVEQKSGTFCSIKRAQRARILIWCPCNFHPPGSTNAITRHPPYLNLGPGHRSLFGSYFLSCKSFKVFNWWAPDGDDDVLW